MKKFFKVLGIVILLLVIALFAAPYLFKDKITELIKTELNKALNAEVDFAEVDLSLFRAFPDARLEIENLSVINKAPFAGDTLFFSKAVKLDLPVGDLFNGAGEPIGLNELIVDGAVANFIVNENGIPNWDVTVADSTATQKPATESEGSGGFALNFKHYELNDSRIVYEDVTTQIKLVLDNMNHYGNGDFSLGESTLETYTEANVFYDMAEIGYLSGQIVKLDADILMDLENQKYTFKENQAFINELELKMNGFVQLLENDATMVDLSFNAPSSDFKNFFAIIPETYRTNLDGITTTGDFKIDGTINGMVDDTYIPKLNINIVSNNASVQYPDLPQKITGINIDTHLVNETGLVEDTYVDIRNTSFNIGSDRMTAEAMIKNLTGNMDVDVKARGKLDFKNLANAFPLPENMDLDGSLDLDMAARFDMESIEKERYERINTKGSAKLINFKYLGDAFSKPFFIETAAIDMTTSRIKLSDLKAKTGNTDLSAKGTIDNLLGFMLQDQGLKGRFTVSSNTFDTSDFMTTTTDGGETASAKANSEKDVNGNKDQRSLSGAEAAEAIKIPAFLDANLDFSAGQVLYDGLVLKNVSGVALVRDETMTFNNVKTDIFNGNIGVNGSLSTKGATPKFDMALDMKNLDIAQSFQGFDMFQQLVPIIGALQGKINTDLKFSGNLNNDLTPIMSSLAGDALAQLLTKDVDVTKNPLLNTLNQKVDFINLEKLNLSDFTTKLNFANGAVQVAPFDFNVKDIAVTASGSHSLTNEMNYTMDLKVPAKYFGKEGASLLSKLEDKDIASITVPVPVRLGGAMTAPKVNLDLQSAVTNLTNQIVEIQKQKLKDKGEEAIGGAINDILKGNDPTKGIKDILKGNKNETATDSTNTAGNTKAEDSKDKVKEAASGLIKGLFGKKKDTTNKK
ncbi:MAG: AsmA-like C-terminal region-containing protein [Nonlabens sp.]